ncbi:MAG: PAS domain S-box protein [Bacteroidota bacterium]
MKNTENQSENLRKKAEELLRNKSEAKILELIEELAFQNEEKAKQADELGNANANALKLTHELEVHQIELETLNIELIEAKEQAEIAAKKYSELYDLAPTGHITISKEGKIIELNLTGATMLGKERLLLINSKFGFFVSNDTIATFNSFLEKTFSSKARESCDVTLLTSSKTPVYIHLTGIVTESREQCHVTVVDITWRKLAEEALKDSEKKFRTVADYTSDWEYWMGADGRIIYISPSCERISGYKPEEFLSDSSLLKKIIHPGDANLFEDHSENLKSQEHLNEIDEFDFRILKKDGSLAYVGHLSRPVFDDKGNYEGRRISNRDITKLRQAEKEKLDDSESRYRSIFLGSSDGILIADVETKMITFANPTQCEMLGYTEDELKTTTIAGIHPIDTFPDTLAGFESIARGEKTIARDIQCLRKNREIFYVDIAASFITINGRKCLVGFFRDITDSKQADDTLKNNAELLTNLIINLHEGVLLEDSSRKILLTNQLFCDMFGIPVPPEVLLGADCSNAAEESKAFFKDPDKFIADINVILGDKKTALDNELELLDGRFFERDFIPTYLDNKYSGHLWKYRDITQRKQAEIALKEALVKAESGDRLKTAFLQNISHEVRTPLNGILGFGNLLAEPDLTSEEKQNYTRFLKSSSDRLTNTITDYIDISLIVTGNVEVNPKAVNATKVLKELQTRFQHDCDAKNITLKLVIPNDQEHFALITDPELLRKSISCLLNNAIKFTDHGTVTMGCSIKSQTIEFFVVDTGIGIASEAQEKIFEPFVHESMSETRAYQGSGLGLPIIKGFLKLLGGEIRLESEKGKGAAFFFTLPLEQGTTEENEPIDHQIGYTEIIRPVVLIAEDDLYSDFYMDIILQPITSAIFKAPNGQVAVEMCRLHPEISIVLMDVKMPVMDGLEATRQIKSFRKDLPVIAVTAYALSRDKKKALDAGCDDFMSKPVSKKELLEKLKKHGFGE